MDETKHSDDDNIRRQQIIGGFSLGSLFGLVVGAALGLTVARIAQNPADAVYFPQQGNLPDVIRIYRYRAEDEIFVGVAPDTGVNAFRNLDAYLGRISDQSEREIREAEILQRVNWYK